MYVDYAGLICSRMAKMAGARDQDQYRRELKEFGDTCRKEISERFRCTTWVLHQLKGASGSSSPFKRPHHTDAGESSDFATNMAVCGCLGTEDPNTGCRMFVWSKLRYRPNVEVPALTLRINDRFALMEDVTDRFVADTATRQFVTPEELNQVHGTEGLARRPQGGPAGLVVRGASLAEE